MGLAANLTSGALEDETFSAGVMAITPTAADGYFIVTVSVLSDVQD